MFNCGFSTIWTSGCCRHNVENWQNLTLLKQENGFDSCSDKGLVDNLVA